MSCAITKGPRTRSTRGCWANSCTTSNRTTPGARDQDRRRARRGRADGGRGQDSGGARTAAGRSGPAHRAAAAARCELLRNLHAEPGLLLTPGDGEISAFRLSLTTGMGTRRGPEEAGFIRSVDTAVDRFHAEVLNALKGVVPA
ncbi:hypothetical protein GCM10022221_57850 [Actinocorallia aurea]